MQQIPVDASKIQILVVGEPTQQFDQDGKPRLDRDSGRPLWGIDVVMITEGGAYTARLSIPEGGFPKELHISVLIIPEGLVLILYEEKKDRSAGHIWATKSVKVAGGLAGVKAAA